MLAMVLYPRVQEKLRAEIELATDGERFPTFKDVKDLPYLNAVIKETLRWRPMGPLGQPFPSFYEFNDMLTHWRAFNIHSCASPSD